jgi:Flp pilus assembly protein TadG
MVEAALIFPMVVFLTFGAIEYGFAFNEQGTIRATTRSAARAASAMPTASAQELEDAAIDKANASAKNLVTGRPLELWIYEADASGDPPGVCGAGTTCARYVWSTATDKFDIDLGGEWPESDRRACPGDSDRVGVYMTARHEFITGLPYTGSSEIDMSANTIMALEPNPLATGC